MSKQANPPPPGDDVAPVTWTPSFASSSASEPVCAGMTTE